MVVQARFGLLAGGLTALLGLGLVSHGMYLYVKAALAQHLLGTAWARAITTGTPVRPWPWADSRPLARIHFPRRQPLVVLSNADGSSLAFAPGHLTGSAAPGYPGHSVISAHRDTHFRGLQTLRAGDRLHLERLDGVVVSYEVQASEVMHSERQRLRRLGSEDAWLTLVTCYPFDAIRPGGPWRYLLHARAVSTSPAVRAPAADRRIQGVFVGF